LAELVFDEPPDFLPRLFVADFVPLFLPPRAALPFAFAFDFAFGRLVDLALELFAPLLAARLTPPPDFRLFCAGALLTGLFDTCFAFAATFFTAFRTFGAAELFELAARPASAPSTPPTTAPTGPATLPMTAPVAAPAVCFEIGGISIFSEAEPDVPVDF